MNTITIHGLGYVGLTAAVHWARAGWRVIAYDPDVRVIAGLNAGTPRAGEFLSYLDVDVKRFVEEGLIVPTTSRSDFVDCDVHSIAVPTENAGVPDDSIVMNVVERLLRLPLGLAEDRTFRTRTILVESTLTPGTIDRLLDERFDPMFRKFLGSALFLAVCPRRDWFADRELNLERLTRVVGGVTPACTERAVEILSHVSRDIRKTSYRTAEVVKALENALLHVPVMLATELAMNMPSHNIAEALELACTHWRLMKLYLGMGTGGRCVPLGTQYLLQAAGPGGILEAAVTTDRHMRVACATTIGKRKVKNALVLGIAYRPEFKDAGLSPGLAVAQYLRRDFGIEVYVHDPMWTPRELENVTGFPTIPETGILGPDAVLLATPHEVYRTMPEQWIKENACPRVILDGRGTWAKYRADFENLGTTYLQVGMAGWLP